MTQIELLLLVTALTGIFAVRWTVRLAPLSNELPVKTLAATVLSALVAGPGLFPNPPYLVSDSLVAFVTVFGPLYAFAPLFLVGLSRARRFGWVGAVTWLLYWFPEGRAAAFRLPAQVALQQGDGVAAERFASGQDPLLLAQAYALQGRWEEVLELELPDQGQASLLAGAARVEALIGLERLGQAQQLVTRMREVWQQLGTSGSPAGYRSLILSEARVEAELGGLRVGAQQARATAAGTSPAPSLRRGGARSRTGG